MDNGVRARHDPILALELYIDVISRIIPGSVLIAGIFCREQVRAPMLPEGLLQSGWGVALTVLIVFVVACYTVGMFLSFPGYLLSMVYYVQVWRRVNLRRSESVIEIREKLIAEVTAPSVSIVQTGQDSPTSARPNQCGDREHTGFSIAKLLSEYATRIDGWRKDRRIYSELDIILHEYLKVEDDSAAIILPKMRAEAQLFANLAAALFALASLVSVHGQWLVVMALCVTGILSLVASGFRFFRFLSRTLAFWKLVELRHHGTREST